MLLPPIIFTWFYGTLSFRSYFPLFLTSSLHSKINGGAYGTMWDAEDHANLT